MRTKQQKEAFRAYLLECISTEGREAKTPAEKIAFVFDCFESEYNYKQNQQRYPNYQERVANWLMGLPSAIGIDFTNYQILERAKEFGFIPANATERQKDNALKLWFPGVAFELIRMREKKAPSYAPYQPKTGSPCFCKPGIERDNCQRCEGTGMQIDFKAIRNLK